MITVGPHPTDLFSMHAEVAGIPVYLDNFAIKELAKGDPDRRKRFIATLDRGVEILFSVSNAVELTGLQGDSFDKIRAFLDEIGPRWFPVEFTPETVIESEQKGRDPSVCCFDENLLKAFTATRINRSTDIKVADLPASLPPNFFQLGRFMEWLAPQRDSLAAGKARLGKTLSDRIKEYRAKHEANPTWLETYLPLVSFDQARPATFVYRNLVRLLVLESKSHVIMPNDGIDFCQAVIASAYASAATMDKHWKRRVEKLPKPNKLARIYYRQELDQMVRDIERTVDRVALQRGRTLFSS